MLLPGHHSTPYPGSRAMSVPSGQPKGVFIPLDIVSVSLEIEQELFLMVQSS